MQTACRSLLSAITPPYHQDPHHSFSKTIRSPLGSARATQVSLSTNRVVMATLDAPVPLRKREPRGTL